MKINILGHEITIERMDSVNLEDEQVTGLSCFNSDMILLATKYGDEPLSEDNIAEAYLHEIIHHINDKLGLNLSEVTIRRLGVGLYQVLKDNKISF